MNMNKAITTLIVSSLLGLTLVSCSTTSEQKQQTCEVAQASYEAYQAVIAAGRKPSDAEIYAAAAAAAFLHVYCGWHVPETRALNPYDPNLVPRLVPGN